MESRAKTDKMIKELNAELKDREEIEKKLMKHLEKITNITYKGCLKK